MMHCDIPTYPFVASVRLHSRGTTPQRTRANTMHSEWSEAGSVTPGSFPPTPESRATYLSRSFDRVDNVVFVARDKLRMEALASDVTAAEGVRRGASKLLLGGKFGTFDMQHTSPLIRLSYGNHCASKFDHRTSLMPPSGPVEEGESSVPLVCSSRASLSVRRNVYVYVEYLLRSVKGSSSMHDNLSITTSSDKLSSIGSSPEQSPAGAKATAQTLYGMFSVGLASGEFQLDGTGVGCSARSVGLSSTGCLSICTGLTDDDVSTFQLQTEVQSGDRLGMLLYLPGRNFSQMSSRTTSPSRPASAAAMNRPVPTDVHAPAVGEVAPNSVPPRVPSRMDSGGSISTGYWDADLSVDEGASASLDSVARLDTSEKGTSISFNVNGCVIPMPMLAQYDISDVSWDYSEDVFPVLSLQADNIAIWAGFSVDDVKYRSREEIGAPHGEVIYCLDGSVLIDAAH